MRNLVVACLAVCTLACGGPSVPVAGSWYPTIQVDGKRQVLQAAPGCPAPGGYQFSPALKYMVPADRLARDDLSVGMGATVTSVVGTDPVVVETGWWGATSSGEVASGFERLNGPTFTLTPDPSDPHLMTIRADGSFYGTAGPKAPQAEAHTGVYTDDPQRFPAFTVGCDVGQESFGMPVPPALAGTWVPVSVSPTVTTLAAEPGCKASFGAAIEPPSFVIAGGQVTFNFRAHDPGNGMRWAVDTVQGADPLVVTFVPEPKWGPPSPPGVPTMKLTATPYPGDPHVWSLEIADENGAVDARTSGYWTNTPDAYPVAVQPCVAGQDFFRRPD